MDALQIRINDLISKKKVSVYKLAKDSGLNQSTINPQINGTNEVQLPLILAILTLFPDVSAEWLLRGEEPMYRNNIEQASKEVAEYSNIHMGHHNNNNVGSGTQTITQQQLPTMTKEQAMAALIKQNEQILEILSKQ